MQLLACISNQPIFIYEGSVLKVIKKIMLKSTDLDIHPAHKYEYANNKGINASFFVITKQN